eukprot:CAMPEP_0171198198 /NCGR_PEP_ID=MMETSP0790-20130122/22807_1 /TAXON_ID=2925 /ORGANISM="Alexandrium catenella, Strain OF101" /LENGTH=516 /DNA_ID=CAMNT_0011663471 /DNA_START=125 /DNA_END=1672 /DNA_ORIENTATION=-
MVLEYSCRDDSAFIAMGKHLKEVRWKVAALGRQPMEIKLNVEKQPMFDPDVGILCDGQKLYPAGAGDRGKMKDDFEYKWPFRGEAKHLSKPNFWEVRPKTMGDNWFPATSVAQKKDGSFEAVVWLPDGQGSAKQIALPSVEKVDIREARTKQPLDIPYRTVVLAVPKSDPVQETTLTLTDEVLSETITHYFARPTPAPRPEMESLPGPSGVTFALSQDRKSMTSQVSHSVLSSYMSQEPRSVEATAHSKAKMSWRFRIGPYAEHTVLIEKKLVGHTAQSTQIMSSALGGMKQVTDLAEMGLLQQSKTVCLSVDGKALVEAAAEDFDADCPEAASAAWSCKFRFIGERSAKFLVYETNGSGMTLDTTDLVEGLREDQIKISKVCTVCIPDLTDLSTAALCIDGAGFNTMRPHEPPAAEPPLAGDPQVLEMQYNIKAPYKIRDVAPLAALHEKLQAGGVALSNLVKDHWDKSQPGLQAFQDGMGQFFNRVNAPAGAAPTAPAASSGTGAAKPEVLNTW